MVSTREPAPFAISAQPNHNGEPAISKIERVRVTLRAKTDYAANLSTKRVKSDLSIAINAHWHCLTEWLMRGAAPN